jgi:hypothetical protein
LSLVGWWMNPSQEMRAMSLRPLSAAAIPARTATVAWQCCPKGAPAMLIRDRLGELFEDEEFLDWYPTDGRPSLSPAQLMLVSV